MKIKVKITQFIIDASDGFRACISGCLIARTCQEIFPGCTVYPRLGIWVISLNDSTGRCIALPSEAAELADNFDSGKKIIPTSFEIDVPMSIIESIGISSVYKILSESKTLECVEI